MNDPRKPPVRAVLLDLLMGTMDSMSAWSAAAGNRHAGLAWRDAVTERMTRAGRYVPYDLLVARAAKAVGLPADASRRLEDAWRDMRPWPDAVVLREASVPYAFVTNCSRKLGLIAADGSGLEPAFTLSAEDAGWYKPSPEIYRMACERIGADRREVVFVAGAPYDARGAAAAGLRSVLVRRRRTDEHLPPEVVTVDTLHEALGVIQRPLAGEGC